MAKFHSPSNPTLRPLPKSAFPGMKYVTRTAGGCLVHLPRLKVMSASGDSKETPEKPSPSLRTGYYSVPIDESSISCCKCDYSTALTDSEGLAYHFLFIHQTRIFFCPFCPGRGSYFYLPGTLRKHVVKKHHSCDSANFEASLTMQVYLNSMHIFLSYMKNTFDPLGRLTVTAASDHCFHTYCPYVSPHVSKSSRTQQISSENNYW